MKKFLLIISTALLFCFAAANGQTKLYGLSNLGGSSGGSQPLGTIFHYNTATATNTFDHSMGFFTSGGNPQYTNLTEGDNNKFYGMTSAQGVYNKGVIFEWDPSSNIYTKKIDFDGSNGENPRGSLTFYNGKFYGVTFSGGANGYGVLFEWDPVTNNYTVKINFDDNGINRPEEGLTIYNDKFYGVTAGGIFEWDPTTNIFTTKFEFDFNNHGAYNGNGFLTLSNGKFYGMTLGGGINNLGTIYEWDPATSTFVQKFDFNTDDGGEPFGSLTILGGKFYGMTRVGGANDMGVIFEWDPNTNIYTKKVDLDETIGGSPYGSLTESNNKLYGLTSGGGGGYGGVIFEWDPATNIYAKKIDFNSYYQSETGFAPKGTLSFKGGKFYGLCSQGGINSTGVIFEWDPATNTYTKKIDLNENNGTVFTGSLTQKEGKFYGTTHVGGRFGLGVIFEFDPQTNVYTRKIDFRGDAASPAGSLTLVGNKFYGVKRYPWFSTGTHAIFEWDPITNNYTDKISLPIEPEGTLSLFNGKLYGIGGSLGAAGSIFEYDPVTNIYTNRIDLSNPLGISPVGSLVLQDGQFYGMAGGGANNKGVIFQWDPATNVCNKRIDFDGTNGAGPVGSLTLMGDKFYGMTTDGGTKAGSGTFPNGGVIFEWDPATNIFTKKIDLDKVTGSNPIGSLTFSGGKFYGKTFYGGANDGGVVFEWDPETNIYSKTVDFSTVDDLRLADFAVYNTTPSISVKASLTGTVCTNTPVTFTSIIQHGGDAPFYQWQKNGVNVGSNNSTYTNDSWIDGDVITCTLTSNATYITSNNLTSNSITIPVSTVPLAASVHIDLTSGSLPACANEPLVFTATTVNGGHVTYQWQKNGINTGSNSAVYTNSSWVPGDIVSCTIISSLSCASPATASSSISIPVTTVNLVPSVSIALTSGANPSCAGETLTFTATQVNGGDALVYQWLISNFNYTINVGDNSPTFTYNAFISGDIVRCRITSNKLCASQPTALSSGITVRIPGQTTYYRDADNDGFGDLNNPTVVCSPIPPEGYVSNSFDCDDTKPTYADLDGDGFGAGSSSPCGVANNTDCNDYDESVHSPQTFYADYDNDGFGDLNNPATVCSSAPPNAFYVSNSMDCNPDQTTYVDNDGDGYGAGPATPCGVPDHTDWDDNDPNIHEQPSCTPTFSDNSVRACSPFNWNGASYNSSGAYIYETINEGGCDSTAILYLNIVAPSKPSTPPSISGPTNVCPYIGTGTATYSISPVPANVLKYRWTLPANITIVSATSDSASITVSFARDFASNTNKIIKVKAIGCSGISAERSFTLSVPLPAKPGTITATSTNACLYINSVIEDTFRIKKVANANAYFWTVPAGSTIASHPGGTGINDTIITVSFDNSFVSGTSISVLASAACGNSLLPSVKTIILTPAATPGVITGPTDVCTFMVSAANPTGTQAVYTIRKVATASSYNWIVPAGASLDEHPGGIGTAGDTIIKVTFSSGFVKDTIRVVAVNGCSISLERKLTVSKLPATPGTIYGDALSTVAAITDVCPVTGLVTYAIKKVATAIAYDWVFTGAGAAYTSITHPNCPGVNDTIVMVSFASGFTTATLSVKSVNDCGSIERRLTIFKLAATPAKIYGDGSSTAPAITDVCPIILSGGGSLTYAIKKVAHATSYDWAFTGAGATVVHPNGPGIDDTVITVSFTSDFTTATLSVKSVRACGSSNLRTLFITKKAPAAPTISGNAFPCPSSTEVYTASSPTGSSYIWTVPAKASIVGPTTGSSITVNFLSTFVSGSITAKAVSVCGTSSSKSFAVKKCTVIPRAELTVANLTEKSNPGISIYPNPSNGNFNIAVNREINKSGVNAVVEIVNELGQPVYRNTAKIYNSIVKVKIDRRLANGMYMVHCMIDGETITKKIIINR